LNDPFVIESARLWAKRLTDSNPDASAEDRIRTMFTTAFARQPGESELAASREYVSCAADPSAAWADLAQSLFNAKEFIFLR
jgi:hypothetical protein